MECMKQPAAGLLSSFFPTQRDDAAMTQDQEYLRVQRNRVAPEPLSFPATQAVLWNRTAQGDSEILHLTRKRNVRLYINEKTLRLAHRHVTQSNSSLECFLVGSISVDSREDSIDVTVDRFDPGREVLIGKGSSKVKRKVPTTVVPGDHIVPVTLIQGLSGADSSVTHTKEEFHKAFQVLFGRICGQEPMNLSHLLSLKVSCHVHGGDNEIIINVHCGTITMATKIQATPVAAVPIIPTALARNLSGPLRLSEVQGVPKNGYLTMDHTRKLLLLLESDPKAFSLPLLGIWVSGIFSIHHPFIWACCVRFIHSTAIQQRVLAPPNSFLLLLYSPVNNTPEFWECRQDQGESEQKMFEYYSCYENLHLEIPPGPSSSDPLCFELFPAPGGMGRSLFEQAVEMWGKEQKQLRLNQDSGHNQGITLLKQGSGEDDPSLIPRPSPSPHPQNVQFVLPDVKETSLSLSFEEHISGEHTGQDLTNQQIFPHPKPRQQQPKPQGKSKQRIQNGQENGLVMFQKKASPGFGVGKEHVKQSQSNGAPVNSPSREPLKQILAPNQTLDKVMSKKAKGSLPRPYPLQSSVVQKVPKHRGIKPHGHNIQEKTEKAMGSHSIPRSETIGRELSAKEANIMQGTDSVRDQSKSKIPGNEIVRGNPQDFEVEDRRPCPKQRTLSSLKDNKNRLEQVDQQQFLRHSDHQVMTEKKLPLPVDQVQRPFLETVFEGETPDGTLNRSMDESELERHITGTSEISQGPPGMHQFQINSGNGYSKTAGSDSPGLILDHSRMQRSHGYQRDTESKEERLAQPMPSGKDGNKEMCDDIAGCSAKEGLDNFKDLIAKEGTTKSSDVSPQMQNKGIGKLLKDLEENIYDRRHRGACMENKQVDSVTGQSNQNCPAEEVSHPDPYELLMRQEAQLRQLQEQIKLLLHHQHAQLPTPNTLLTPPRTPQFEFSHGNNRPPDHSPVSMVTACTNTGASLLLGTPVKQRGKRSAATSPIKENEVMHSGRSLPASSTKSSQDNSKKSQRHDSSVNPEELTNQMIELDDPSQTLASSLHAVDIPSFVESPSGVTSPSPLDKANRGGMGTSFTSPVLESASILVEERVREGETHNTDKDIFTEEERTGKQSNHVSLLHRNERQFYDNLLSQVKNILDQQVQEESDPSEKPSQESKQNADVPVPEPTREEVITATMRELEKIKNSTLGAAYVDSSKSPLSAKQWPLQRSASLSAIPDHPHINYMSFSVDETLDEVFSEADLKYLTEIQLQELQHISSHRKKHGRDRAVTFSVLPEGVSVLSRKGTVEKGHLQCDSSSLTAVDYTWNNLSMATKEYLGKYCLAPQKPSDSDGGNVDCNAAMKGSDETGERLGQQISVRSQGCTAPPCTPEPTKRGDSDSQILDIRRLKKLPKLF